MPNNRQNYETIGTTTLIFVPKISNSIANNQATDPTHSLNTLTQTDDQ